MVIGYFRHGATAALAGAALAILVAGALGYVSLTLWQVLLGALLFYGSEYTTHRNAFHAPPAPWAWALRLQRRLHYDHHVEPARLDLLFLPLWFLVPMLAGLGVVVGLLGGRAAAAPVLLGAMLAILHYEWAHYVAHIPYAPKTRWGRWLKAYHLRHHFISEKQWFGVSNPSMDLVFGTFRGPTRRSATTRNLRS